MVEIKPIKKVKGEIMLCGDKSITHRAFIFSTISNGESLIINPNRGDDTQRTLEIMEKIGSKISFEDRGIRIKGIGFDGIREPDDVLNAGNSGTTIRLLSGLFSSLKDKFFVITGDDSLRNRPMRRVVEPISLMGGLILGRDNGNYPPLAIYGRKLSGIEYDLKKPSAQVKSAIILATLNSNNKSIIIEKIKTRDHTEIMLKEFGGKIEIEDDKVVVYPVDKLYGREIYVPGDFSSASYFILLAMLLPDSEIIIKNISLNPTRTYLLEKLIENGGDTKILNERVLNGEKIGDIVVKTSFIKKNWNKKRWSASFNWWNSINWSYRSIFRRRCYGSWSRRVESKREW